MMATIELGSRNHRIEYAGRGVYVLVWEHDDRTLRCGVDEAPIDGAARGVVRKRQTSESGALRFARKWGARMPKGKG